MQAPEPFTIHVFDDELADLKARLAQTRIIPNEIAAGSFDPNGAWSYGTDRSTVQAFVKYWLEEFDWRRQEAELNTLAHFRVTVKELRMHFIHERSSKPGAIPLLLVHGWPGSVVEFLKVIPALVEAGFHVVAPSIPGFGWSDAPTKPGADCVFMAEHMDQLMQQLGYTQYAAQGGDWGSIITGICAYRFPEHCVAYHTNMPLPIKPPTDLYAFLRVLAGLITMDAKEWSGLKDTFYFMKHETAYQLIQGTKPQSLGYGLNDSPVGLLAWILEKFQSWSDCGSAGPQSSGLSQDDILTNVMVYWTTQTITSSCRIYYETLGHAPGKPLPLSMIGYIPVPTGILHANDLFKLPRFLADLNYNLKHVSRPVSGGHFFCVRKAARVCGRCLQFL